MWAHIAHGRSAIDCSYVRDAEPERQCLHHTPDGIRCLYLFRVGTDLPLWTSPAVPACVCLVSLMPMTTHQFSSAGCRCPFGMPVFANMSGAIRQRRVPYDFENYTQTWTHDCALSWDGSAASVEHLQMIGWVMHVSCTSFQVCSSVCLHCVRQSLHLNCHVA